MESHGDDLTSYGSRAAGTESNEEISLVQDLERELGAVVQRHRIPPDELQQLFEVHTIIINGIQIPGMYISDITSPLSLVLLSTL